MSLYYSTVNNLLKNTLLKLMSSEQFKPFRLVGGTSLSLQLGHRLSVGIDLFTDAPYGSLDFGVIDDYWRSEFSYVSTSTVKDVSFGRSYYIGNGANDCVKLDLFYTDEYIQPFIEADGIRLATIDEITAMKMEVVHNGGRKKDFWDLHKILETHSVDTLLKLHKERYPYTHNSSELIDKLNDYSLADEDFDPICLEGKYWEIIKMDLVEIVEAYKKVIS